MGWLLSSLASSGLVGPYHTKLLTDAVLGQRVATSFSKGADFAPGFFWGGASPWEAPGYLILNHLAQSPV